jgi:prepilin-type N-terminal cleavage/methylation domain-containing protein
MNKEKPTAIIGSQRCGFTIAEMLFVVVIIALVASVGGGLYVGTYKRMLVEKAARELLLTAKYARIRAIEQQQPHEIQLDVANNRFFLTTSRWNEQTEKMEQVVVQNYYCRPVELGGEVKFEDINVMPTGSETTAESEQEQSITFAADGTAESAIVQIGDGKNHYTVSICAPTGKATMYLGTADKVRSTTVDLDAE